MFTLLIFRIQLIYQIRRGIILVLCLAIDSVVSTFDV